MIFHSVLLHLLTPPDAPRGDSPQPRVLFQPPMFKKDEIKRPARIGLGKTAPSASSVGSEFSNSGEEVIGFYTSSEAPGAKY